MYALKSEDWELLYTLLFRISSINDPTRFAIQLLVDIKDIYSYDQSLIYFLDGNRKVYNRYLINFDQRWSDLYLTYFVKEENNYHCFTDLGLDTLHSSSIHIRYWEDEPDSDFKQLFIRRMNLYSTLGFSLTDKDGRPQLVCALDRIARVKITDKEEAMLSVLLPLINHIFEKFSCTGDSLSSIARGSEVYAKLTPREQEVASMLCKGISPGNISQLLNISVSTANKHIEHIYAKLHVSSRQELLVRLLGSG